MTGVQTFALPIWGPAGNGDRRFGPWRVIIAVGDDARAIADTPRHDVRRIGECRPIERLHDFGARAETNLGRRAFIALVISRRRRWRGIIQGVAVVITVPLAVVIALVATAPIHKIGKAHDRTTVNNE